jgi:hypothetical protein
VRPNAPFVSPAKDVTIAREFLEQLTRAV